MTHAATKAELCNAITEVLGAAPIIKNAQTYNELTEGINTFPTLQVYPTDSGGGSAGGTTSRRTMGQVSPVRQEQVTVVVDIYCSQRKDLKNDMRKVIEVWDAMEAVLDEQVVAPYFACPGIREFSWRATYGERQYGDSTVTYSIVQFQLSLAVY